MEDVFFDTDALRIDSVSSVPTALSMAKGGLGIFPAPAALVVTKENSDEIARLPVRQELPNIHLSAYFREDANSSLMEQIVAIARNCAGSYAANSPEGLVWT